VKGVGNMRNVIELIGDGSRVNNELVQLLNWRFTVHSHDFYEHIKIDKRKTGVKTLFLINMAGDSVDYAVLFEELSYQYSDIPIVTIGTNEQYKKYASFYENSQFHMIKRPVVGKKIIEICRAVFANDISVANEIINTNSYTGKKGEKCHILIVDDNAMVLRNIKSILEPTYTVAVAPSGVHAFVAMGKKLPDLILLDYQMPEMNGKEVMEKLRSEKEFDEIPIVFLTSVDSKEIVMELLSLKPAGYILKPAESDMLLERIESIIGK